MTDQDQADAVEAILAGERWPNCPHCGRLVVRTDDPEHMLRIHPDWKPDIRGGCYQVGEYAYVSRCEIKKITKIHVG